LPKENDVKKFLALSCWQVNDELSLELLRIFSSMNSGKGLPKEKDVKKFLELSCWQGNGKFSLELLRA
jgi:hypothetical protein